MVELIARKRPKGTIDWGSDTYNLFDQAWPYTLGYMKHEYTADLWTIYCLSRRDIGFDLAPTQTFPTRDAALGFVRDLYEAALARYEQEATDLRALLNSEEGLSPIVRVNNATCYDDPYPIVLAIYDRGSRSIEVKMTVQEALTALDYSSHRGGPTISIQKQFMPSSPHRPTYASWKIPFGSRDYHLLGWRSDTGMGRRHCDGFYAALDRHALGKVA